MSNLQVERMNEMLEVAVREPNALMVNVENSAKGVVDQIADMTLITANDVKQLAKAQTFILSTYTDVPQFRPLVIKLSSVLNDRSFPTADGKYWQCKKEAEVHFNQLVSEMYKYERCVVDVEEMDYVIASMEKQLKETVSVDKIDPIKMGFEIRRMKIKRDEYIFNMKLVEKSIKYRISEVTEWAAISESMMKPGCRYDTKDYNAHLAQELYMKLEQDINNAAKDGNKDVDNLKAQLATLQRLVKDAIQK